MCNTKNLPDQPNIVLIFADQWRGDCLGIVGHPTVQTPYLDAMASKGTVFRRCYAATPSCIPARASLHTGLTPRSHGRVGYRDGVPWDYEVTLAGEFTRHGYQTECVGKMHVYPERTQLGFQHVQLHDGYLHYAREHADDIERVDDYLPWLRQRAGHDVDYAEHGMGCNSYTVRPWPVDEHLHPTNWVAGQSIDFLRRRDPRKPFLLMMSFHRPHPPLDAPAWATGQYLDAPLDDPPVGDWADDLLADHYQPHDSGAAPRKMAPHLLQQARAGYYGHLTHIDHQVHRFTEALNAHGLGRNTWFVFAADHGDLLGDHNLFAKSLPYEGSARVPLFVVPAPCQADTAQPGNGRANSAPTFCDAPVELRDLMPTLLDIAGLPIPRNVEGQSLLPLTREPTANWRDHVHGEHTSRFGSVHYLTDGKRKYIWFARTGREQLFDLENDPGECRDLACQPDRQEELAGSRQALIRELTGREESFTDGQRLKTVEHVDPVRPHLQQAIRSQVDLAVRTGKAPGSRGSVEP